jgi:hypothetical protein
MTGNTARDISRSLGMALSAAGTSITQRIDRNGLLPPDRGLSRYGVTAVHYVPQTNYTVISVFWNFMNAQALTYQDASMQSAPLFANPFYARLATRSRRRTGRGCAWAGCPLAYSATTMLPKAMSSRASRAMPGIATGASAGSPGTRNTPQSVACIAGPTSFTPKRSGLSKC